MKFSLVLLAVLVLAPGVNAQKDTMLMKTTPRLGAFSPDSENENGEKDVLLTSSKLPGVAEIFSPGSNKMFLKNHAQAEEISKKAADFLKNMELQVSLLPQHKYMINDCLGIKASVGDYKIQLALPYVRVDQNGLLIRFEIEKIVDNKVTVRTRPCYKDGQCHFSPQLAIGGTMTNLRLDITLNPIMDLQQCKIISIGMPHFRWSIGGLNYKPLQNNLDAMVKNMMEDALTFATELIMPGRIAEAFNQLVLSGGSCGLPSVESSGNETTSNSASSGNEAWELIPNTALKGATGRLVFECKDSLTITAHLFRAGEQRHFETWHQCRKVNFIPGMYDINVNGQRISNVPVEKGKDTRIKLGFLQMNLTDNSGWQVLDLSGKKVYNNYGTRRIALPVGQYKISMQGREMPINIKDRQLTEF